jgi:hypothetical protein
MIWVWRATAKWYWQGKTEELGEKPVPVPLYPPQIPHGLTRARTLSSAVRGRRLATWAMARPLLQLAAICPLQLRHFLMRSDVNQQAADCRNLQLSCCRREKLRTSLRCDISETITKTLVSAFLCYSGQPKVKLASELISCAFAAPCRSGVWIYFLG